MSPVHIQQVLLNLLANAAQVSGKGGTVRVSASRRDSAVAVSFEDQGPGIPAGAEKEIFKPFFTTKAKGKGTGLGLHIARQIVERHRGRITAGNKPRGGGAVFTFTLPGN